MTREFESVAKEARQVFAYYKIYPGSSSVCHALERRDMNRIKYVGENGENKEVIDITLPFKLLGISNAIERRYGCVTLENPFEIGNKPPKCKNEIVLPYIENVYYLYEKLYKEKGSDSDLRANYSLGTADEKT